MRDIHTLHFFTTYYPYGSGESFVHDELLSLSKHYKHIKLYPTKYNSKSELKIIDKVIPENVEIIYINQEYDFKKLAIQNIHTFVLFFIYDIMKDKKSRVNKLKHLKTILSYFVSAINIRNQVIPYISNIDESTFYSFWMNEGALNLSILKHHKKINSFTFKCHGFDVYNEIHARKFIPFRVINYYYTNLIITISKKNAHYIKELYPSFKKKLRVNYLGTKDKGESPIVRSTFTIFSCSFMRDFKRVHYIPKILTLIKEYPIKWIHAGSGDALDKVTDELKLLPSNITYELLGNLTHDEIFDVYRTTPINLFVHLSLSEGLPVSMMEAISFGIPIVATNVGGVGEIVTPKTGTLIPKFFDPEETAEIIKKYIDMNDEDSEIMRNNIRKFWETEFEHSNNFTKLLLLIND